MKNSTYAWASSGTRHAVILGFIAGLMAIAGCSNPSDTAVNDLSTTKNKRTARIEQLKGGKKPDVGVKKEGP